MIDLAEAMRVDQLALKNVSLGSWVKEHLRERMARKMLPKDEKYRKYRVDEEGVELKIQDAVCSWTYENGVVLANGDVTTCCYDADGDHVFANVHRDGGLMTILRSEKMREVRDADRGPGAAALPDVPVQRLRAHHDQLRVRVTTGPGRREPRQPFRP